MERQEPAWQRRRTPFRFAQAVQIVEIEVQNLTDPDRFRRNYRVQGTRSRPTTCRPVAGVLENTNEAQKIRIASLDTTELKFIVTSTYPAQATPEGAPPFNELAIQEFRFYGRAVAVDPARLLLDVGNAVGGGRTGLPHQAGDHDDGHDVRRHPQELRRDRCGRGWRAWLAGVGEAEHERGTERPDRMPPSEDHGGQADEAAPTGHVLVEGADDPRVKKAPTEPGDGSTEDDVHVPEPKHVHAERVGRLRDARPRHASGGPSGSGTARR